MKKNEYDFYSERANWSFEDIDYTSEVITNWIYEDEIKKRVKENTKILDLGTAAGEKVLKKFPNCAEILGTDFSDKMIETANKNLLQSGRKNISFRVMDNLKMDTPDNYFDLVTARHTIIDPLQILKTLKEGGQLIIRGVDKLDCWSLKRMFKRGQAYHDVKPISLIDYETIIPLEKSGPSHSINYNSSYAIEIKEMGVYQITYFLNIATSVDTNYIVSVRATGTKIPASDIKSEGKADTINKVNGSVLFGLV